MSAVVAAAEVVFELRAEFLRDAVVFGEDGVPAVTFAFEEGGGRDVFGDPLGVAACAVEAGD